MSQLPEGVDVARVRVEKTRVLSQVSGLAAEHGVRVLAAGGPVFAVQGLISPDVSRSVALIVDVSTIRELLARLRESGWALSPTARRMAVLPSVVISLEHPQSLVRLAIYTEFPGFYIDPKRVFAILWARRNTMTLYGTTVPILDRLSTVIMAVHDRLGPQSWNPRAHNYQHYHIEQFSRVLKPRERQELLELVRALSAVEPMRPLLDALELDAGPVMLPTEGYAKWRLAIPSASSATLAVLALAECPPQRRMVQFVRVFRSSPQTAFGALLGSPRAWWLILTSRQRISEARRKLIAPVQ